MTDTKNKAKTSKIFRIVGSSLLLIMAVFHGSGFSYVSKSIATSNVEGFLKEIVPALFAHPTIHLIGLAAFGILTLYLKQEIKKVVLLLSLLIVTDALLAFYLGGIIPDLLLTVAALCFVITGWRPSSDHTDL